MTSARAHRSKILRQTSFLLHPLLLLLLLVLLKTSFLAIFDTNPPLSTLHSKTTFPTMVLNTNSIKNAIKSPGSAIELVVRKLGFPKYAPKIGALVNKFVGRKQKALVNSNATATGPVAAAPPPHA